MHRAIFKSIFYSFYYIFFFLNVLGSLQALSVLTCRGGNMGNRASSYGEYPYSIWETGLVVMGKAPSRYGKHHKLIWETPQV